MSACLMTSFFHFVTIAVKLRLGIEVFYVVPTSSTCICNRTNSRLVQNLKLCKTVFVMVILLLGTSQTLRGRISVYACYSVNIEKKDFIHHTHAFRKTIYNTYELMFLWILQRLYMKRTITAYCCFSMSVVFLSDVAGKPQY